MGWRSYIDDHIIAGDFIRHDHPSALKERYGVSGVSFPLHGQINRGRINSSFCGIIVGVIFKSGTLLRIRVALLTESNMGAALDFFFFSVPMSFFSEVIFCPNGTATRCTIMICGQ